MALGWTRSLEALSSPKIYGSDKCYHAPTVCVSGTGSVSGAYLTGLRAKEGKSQARVPGALQHASAPFLCLPDAKDTYPLRPLGE